MGVFLVELGVVLLALALLGAIARRVDLSPIPFFLLAGLVLGEGGIHDVAATEDFIGAAGEIGVLLLLLMLGLEFSAAEFTSTLRRHADSGLVDLLLNAPVGFVAGLLLGYEWQACLALAGITWISSSGIVARLLNDLGRMGHRETPAVLSVLVLEDIAMAVYLPLLVVILAGGSALAAVVAVAIALGLVVVVLVSTRLLGHHLGRLLGHQEDEQVLLRVLGLMLVVAGVTHLVDASAAVGAFLVGLAIPGATADRARSVLRPLRDLFAAMFFLSFGLEVAPASLTPVPAPGAAPGRRLVPDEDRLRWLRGRARRRRSSWPPACRRSSRGSRRVLHRHRRAGRLRRLHRTGAAGFGVRRSARCGGSGDRPVRRPGSDLLASGPGRDHPGPRGRQRWCGR